MTMLMRKKLWLVGDDEVLDAIADLSRHLDYFQVARVDELPAGTLDRNDHVILAYNDARTGAAMYARTLTAGAAGHVALVPELPGKTAGARAIVAAAELVDKV